MFQDENLIWKIIAVIFCITIPHIKTCYAHIHTHIKVTKFKGHFYFQHTMNVVTL